MADVVYGSRFKGSEGKRVLYFWNRVANYFLTVFSNICTNINLSDMETGFKCFKTFLYTFDIIHKARKFIHYENDILMS